MKDLEEAVRDVLLWLKGVEPMLFNYLTDNTHHPFCKGVLIPLVMASGAFDSDTVQQCIDEIMPGMRSVKDKPDAQPIKETQHPKQ